jgi:hypothetical protein
VQGAGFIYHAPCTLYLVPFLGVPALLPYNPTHAVGLVPGFASLPCFTALRLRKNHHQIDLIAALVPVRTGFTALHIPHAFSNRSRFEKNEE